MMQIYLVVEEPMWTCSTTIFHLRIRLLALGAFSSILIGLTPATAQNCWVYVEQPLSATSGFAPTAIQCVQQNLVTPCRWRLSTDPPSDPSGGDCHEDFDTSDCCTTVPDTPGSQTVREMHILWHGCFGSVGDPDGDNPPMRGQRWYAFHRQMEFDFNRWRTDCTNMAVCGKSFALSPIESVPHWCRNVPLRVGQRSSVTPGGFVVSIPGGGTTTCGNVGGGMEARPNNDPCINCIPFAPCLYIEGGGQDCDPDPVSCPGCETVLPASCDPGPDGEFSTPDDVGVGCCRSVSGGVSFPHRTLEQFPNVEDIATVLDDYFHGQMHGAVADGSMPGSYPRDNNNPLCSVRDPMFWRLHKALDDIVRAWQDTQPVDVILVIDRSGSMDDPDAGSGLTKLDAAFEAARDFAALLQGSTSSGANRNRIGVVSYDGNPILHLGLTPANSLALSDPTGPFNQALDDIRTSSRGCTSIGGGIERALEELCPPGDCQGFTSTDPAANDRRAILLLTDGMENTPPCVQRIDASPIGCLQECRSTSASDQLDFNRIDFTQLVAVGFGSSGSLNGDLLTLLTERQGGIYMQNPNTSAADDLKDFYAKAFAQLTDQFAALDPNGFLAADEPVSEPIEYDSCAFDKKVTFASGWKDPVAPGELRLIVTSPTGDLMRGVVPTVRSSRDTTWENITVDAAGRAAIGTWRGHLIRPHQVFLNGFTTDSFVDIDEGVALVRRQIQRLCPEGCSDVLYFEDGRLGGDSAYELALDVEAGTGLLGSVTPTSSVDEFDSLLGQAPWDLIVYAHQTGPDEPEPYDDLLAGLLCEDQRAIITDTRQNAQGIFKCAGAQRAAPGAEVVDQNQLDGSDQIQAIHSARTVGQTFTATRSGTLSGLELSLDAPGQTGDLVDLVVEILDMAGGNLATAPVLGRLAIADGDVGNTPPMLTLGSVTGTKIDLSGLGIAVATGDRLACRLSTTRSLPETYGIRIALSNAYAGGEYFVGTTPVPDADAAFKLFVIDGSTNWTEMAGDRRLVDGIVKLDNPGYPIATYGLSSTGGDVQATANAGRVGAIVARVARGVDHNWFVDVLVKGLWKLSPHTIKNFWTTEDELIATVRVLTSYIRAGGYDDVDARVEVEYPLAGLGTLITETGLRDETEIGGELLDRRAATIRDLDVPTAIDVFPLFDDGTNGDINPGNYYWSARLPGIGKVDGMYKLRYILEFTVNGCTTRRELMRSVFVDVGVDQDSSDVSVGPGTVVPGDRLLTAVTIVPRDPFGNLWGPGRRPVSVSCGPSLECVPDVQREVVDNSDGSYTVNVVTERGVAGVRMDAFGAEFDVPIDCPECPNVLSLDVESETLSENETTTGFVSLDGPAPQPRIGGALVYLDSSNPAVLQVPPTVIVPTGDDTVSFPIEALHFHDEIPPVKVEITAVYGGEVRSAAVTVVAESESPEFRRGDCNGDGGLDVADPVFLLFFNFLGLQQPPCPAACDANGDGRIRGNVADAVYLLSFSFLGGPAPVGPFPNCGVSLRPEDAALGCALGRGCP